MIPNMEAQSDDSDTELTSAENISDCYSGGSDCETNVLGNTNIYIAR